MNIFTLLLLTLPFAAFSQSQAILEVKMHDYSEFILEVDNKQFESNTEIIVPSLEKGTHHLKVFLPKKYIDPVTGERNFRLINVYDAPILITEGKCYSCTLNEFYQSSISLK